MFISAISMSCISQIPPVLGTICIMPVAAYPKKYLNKLEAESETL